MPFAFEMVPAAAAESTARAAGQNVPLTRPTCPAPNSVNQRLPSEPAVMLHGRPPLVGIRNSVITPAGVIRPILFASASVNHTFPSGPAVIPVVLVTLDKGNSVTNPAGVIRPILLACDSLNHRFPSAPAAMSAAPALPVGIGNSVNPPLVVTRPTLPPECSVNHNAPSGPAVIPYG